MSTAGRSAFQKSVIDANVSQVKNGIHITAFQEYSDILISGEELFLSSDSTAVATGAATVENTDVGTKPNPVTAESYPKADPNQTVVPRVSTNTPQIAKLTIGATPAAADGVGYTLITPLAFGSGNYLRLTNTATIPSATTCTVVLEDSNAETLTFTSVDVSSLDLFYDDGTDSGAFNGSIKKISLNNFSGEAVLENYSIQSSLEASGFIGSPISFIIRDISEYPEMEGEVDTEDNTLYGANIKSTPTSAGAEITFDMNVYDARLHAFSQRLLPSNISTQRQLRQTPIITSSTTPAILPGIPAKNIREVEVNGQTFDRVEKLSFVANSSHYYHFDSTTGVFTFPSFVADNTLAVINYVIPAVQSGTSTGVVANSFRALVVMVETTDKGKVTTTLQDCDVKANPAGVGGRKGMSVTIKGTLAVDKVSGQASTGTMTQN